MRGCLFLFRLDIGFPEARQHYGLRFPLKSLLQYVVSRKISEDYLDAILMALWLKIRGLDMVKFIFGGLSEFVIDNTGLPSG